MSEASSTSSESAPVSNVSEPHKTLISLNMSNITKLTPTNFITWRLQIRSLLEAHELHCFIADEDKTPPETITTATAADQPNPNFAAWKRQDKLLFSALLGSLSLPVQAIVARATTSGDIWRTLTNTYGKPSRSHVRQIKDQFKESSKGTKTVSEYMRGIIDKSDHLALLGDPLPHEDLLDYITSGLGEDYRAVVEMVQGRNTPIAIDELHEKLLNRENTLKAAGQDNFSLPATANTTQLSRGGSSTRGGYNSSRGGYRPSRPYLGKCQICGVQGHGAKRCPQYYSPSPQQAYLAPQFSQYRGPPPSPWSPRAPHLPLPTPQWRPQAHHTTAGSQPDLTPWLLDSAASHHIASDLSNLSLHSPYTGNDTIMIGNGTGLPVTHTGSVSFPSHSKPLQLQNVLCVPEMRRNLISVNKFCKTNNVMVHLCPFDFQVKDLHTGITLLNGKANEGVYEWPLSASKPFASAFSSIKSSPSD
ncbi:PREDICTED: uncharacterized protein LOC104753857 [Camelina sativa]|uniref:Uncharacterized protein LOC104753857 n=1 Tax=Camelina sativa TaxID=90675 RepID=A0ABM0WPT1_CAMSA|nr:PREDICTED: uncharacterized protein LOC104753857 [Camelina sativa]